MSESVYKIMAKSVKSACLNVSPGRPCTWFLYLLPNEIVDQYANNMITQQFFLGLDFGVTLELGSHWFPLLDIPSFFRL